MITSNKENLWIKVKIIVGESKIESVYETIYSLFPNTALQETPLEDGKTQVEIYLSKKTNNLDSDKNNLKKIISKKIKDSVKDYTFEIFVEEYSYDPSQETEWKKYFKPQKIGNKIVIKPSWEEYQEKQNDIVVVIDPGAAFGTGLHETTRGSIILLEEVLDIEKKNKDKLKLLDAGTGSGILAISAYKMGIKNIYAIDNDDDAIKISKENFNINGIEQKNILVETIPLEKIDIKQKYGIILANIIPEVLIKNKQILHSILMSPAHLILSGILDKYHENVVENFTKENKFSLVKKLNIGEWVSLWFKKVPEKDQPL
jgi:ribosomal protein L11 methyltransferase